MAETIKQGLTEHEEQVHAVEQEFRLYNTFMDVYSIPAEEYDKYNVKRGLRNADGTGVIAGLTRISDVHGYSKVDGKVIPEEGRLTYRGFDIGELVDYTVQRGRFGYGPVVYLLLTGTYPDDEAAEKMKQVTGLNRDLPAGFINSVITSQPPRDVTS